MTKELLKIFFIFSPILGAIILNILASIMYDASGNEAMGIYFAFAVVQVIAITLLGFIWSLATRNKPNANKLSLYGYGTLAALFSIGFFMNLVQFIMSSS